MFSNPSAPNFVKRSLLVAMCLPVGDALAGNSFNQLSDYYSRSHFDEISYEKFQELVISSNNEKELARKYALNIKPSTQSVLDFSGSMSSLVSEASSLVSNNPELLFVVHKSLKDGNYPRPLVVEALISIHRIFDKKLQLFVESHKSNSPQIDGAQEKVEIAKSVEPNNKSANEAIKQTEKAELLLSRKDEVVSSALGIKENTSPNNGTNSEKHAKPLGDLSNSTADNLLDAVTVSTGVASQADEKLSEQVFFADQNQISKERSVAIDRATESVSVGNKHDSFVDTDQLVFKNSSEEVIRDNPFSALNVPEPISQPPVDVLVTSQTEVESNKKDKMNAVIIERKVSNLKVDSEMAQEVIPSSVRATGVAIDNVVLGPSSDALPVSESEKSTGTEYFNDKPIQSAQQKNESVKLHELFTKTPNLSVADNEVIAIENESLALVERLAALDVSRLGLDLYKEQLRLLLSPRSQSRRKFIDELIPNDSLDISLSYFLPDVPKNINQIIETDPASIFALHNHLQGRYTEEFSRKLLVEAYSSVLSFYDSLPVSDDPVNHEAAIAMMLGATAILARSHGNGSSSSQADPGNYESTVEGAYLDEYNYQDMLSAINPLSLNDYGFTGDGVRVAVVDSGIDSAHPEFDSKTIYGYDFANSASGYDHDENGHGTHVASIIAADRDSLGMRGVAYDSILYSYKLDNDGDGGLEGLTTDAAVAALFNQHATDQIRVSNNSWGSGATSVTDVSAQYYQTTIPLTLTALANAQNTGTLFVFAAGNEGQQEVDMWGGLPYHITSLADSWLTVVSVGSELTETWYTNRCGVAQDFCVTAPGGGDISFLDGIRAADANTAGYVRMSGTSMAAPHVSGLASALIEKFPTLTSAQIATRIKVTATLAGLTGSGGETLAQDGESAMRAIFGHGLVDADGAASVLGTLIYPVGTSLSASSAGSSISTSVTLPSGLPDSVVNKILEDDFFLFDTFDGATFSAMGKEIFKYAQSTYLPEYQLSSLEADDSNGMFDLAKHQFSGLNYSFSANGFGHTSEYFWGDKSQFFASQPFSQNTSSHLIRWNAPIKNGVFSSYLTLNGDQVSNKIKALGINLTTQFSDNFLTDLDLSLSNETFDLGMQQHSYLPNQSFNVVASAQYKITDNANLFARYKHAALSDSSMGLNSLGLNDVETNALTFGFESRYERSKFSAGFKIDEQLSSGTVSMLTPYAANEVGDLSFVSKSYRVEKEFKPSTFVTFADRRRKYSWNMSMATDNYTDIMPSSFNIGIQVPF